MKKLKVDVERIIKELEVFAREMVTTRIMGKYKAVFKSKGLEFRDYRDYTTQDDAALIDWKASMRVNKLVVKEFEEKRNIKVLVMIGTTQSMLYGSAQKLKSEFAEKETATYIITSAKTGLNVDEAFSKLAQKIVDLKTYSVDMFAKLWETSFKEKEEEKN